MSKIGRLRKSLSFYRIKKHSEDAGMILFTRGKRTLLTFNILLAPFVITLTVDIETPVVVITNATLITSPTQTQYQQLNSAQSSSTNPSVVPLDSFRRSPMNIQCCPHCKNPMRTSTVTSPNYITFVAVFAVLFLFWPMFWLPLVMDRCKRTDHYCGKCHVIIGHVQPLEGCCVSRRS